MLSQSTPTCGGMGASMNVDESHSFRAGVAKMESLKPTYEVGFNKKASENLTFGASVQTTNQPVITLKLYFAHNFRFAIKTHLELFLL